MDYNLLKTFAKVSELGSFTQAAAVLKQPKSRVSRAISALENEIGVQLIRRTTRKVTLTTAGVDFYKSIGPLLSKLDKEITNISNQQDEMSGLIRITAPEDLGQTMVAQAVSLFNEKYPKVEIQTIITNHVLDLAKENIDISFRAGPMADSNLIQRKILKVNFVIIAAPKYLDAHGCPSKIEDLVDHRFLSFKGFEKGYFDTKLSPTIQADSTSMLLKMVLNGNGIAILPDCFCDPYLASGELVRVIPGWKSPTDHIHLLTPPTDNQSRKVKCFIDMVKGMLK